MKKQILSTVLILAASSTAIAYEPVPGYVPPVTLTQTPNYADYSRGVYVPAHVEHRVKNNAEYAQYEQQGLMPASASLQNANYGTTRTFNPQSPEQISLNSSYSNVDNELERIASDVQPAGGLTLPNAQAMMTPEQYAQMYRAQMQAQYNMQAQSNPYGQVPANFQNNGQMMPMSQNSANMYGNIATQNGNTGSNPYLAYTNQANVAPVSAAAADVNSPYARTSALAATNKFTGPVSINETDTTIRKAIEQVSTKSGYTTVWDLSEANKALPDTAISIKATEPAKVIVDALVAKMQTRTTKKLSATVDGNNMVITDNVVGAAATATVGDNANPKARYDKEGNLIIVTESMFKSALVTVHKDSVPLEDMIKDMVNQAGEGQWKVQMYAGTEQVVKPAHIEESFDTAMQRLVRLFNVEYQVFPKGKLVVITKNNILGY